jgi:hypothetical protein
MMALVTTFATTPILHLISRDDTFETDVKPAEEPQLALAAEAADG